MDSWEWTGNYVWLNVNARDDKLTHCQFVLEIPSFLAYPLAQSIAAKPASGALKNISDTIQYPTWKLVSTELHAVLDSMWESVEPETEKVIGNVELLPLVNNPTALPYKNTNGAKTLLIDNIPDCLLPQEKHNAKDVIPCLLCGEKLVLNKVRNHVGSHILHSLHDVEDPKKCKLQSIGENTCGFCGQGGCFTQLKAKKTWWSINCIQLSISLCWNELQSCSTSFQEFTMHKYSCPLLFVSPCYLWRSINHTEI